MIVGECMEEEIREGVNEGGKIEKIKTGIWMNERVSES